MTDLSLDTLQALWAPGHKTSVSPIPLIKGNSLLSASMTFSGFQWADSSSC